MNREDLFYLCTTIGNLSGIPLRVFENDEQIFYHALVDLPKDPMELYRQAIWAVTAHVGYFATPYFDYYGIVNSHPYRLIIGPTRQVETSSSGLRAMAFEANIPVKELDAFFTAMKNIVPMPLDSILQMLCTVNFVLNGERLTLSDIAMIEADDAAYRRFNTASSSSMQSASEERGQGYTGYTVEQRLMDIVSKGDLPSLKKWLSSAPAIRAGILSDHYIRQQKNIFIVTATLASRAAIRGGLDTKTAFLLSDAYIQRCELLKTPEQITNLQFNMIADYTERVERIRVGRNPTQLSIRVANYVQDHLSEVISVDVLTKELLISRSRLTARFKEETGQTLTDFVMLIKIREAKRLLQYTDKSLSTISDYLGFSSQSHFSRIFKKYAGFTPGEFRNKTD